MIVEGCNKFPEHKEILKKLGKALDLKKIIFQIEGYKEIYRLVTKSDIVIKLEANSTILSKGYLNVDIKKT